MKHDHGGDTMSRGIRVIMKLLKFTVCAAARPSRGGCRDRHGTNAGASTQGGPFQCGSAPPRGMKNGY